MVGLHSSGGMASRAARERERMYPGPLAGVFVYAVGIVGFSGSVRMSRVLTSTLVRDQDLRR